MRIDLILLGLLITIESISAMVELTVFLIIFMFAPKLRLSCFKHLKSAEDCAILMLGVIKMDEKKILKTIDEMLADPWQVDIQELFEASVNEPDEIKRNLYDSLYTYILQKRQEDIINRPGFVI